MAFATPTLPLTLSSYHHRLSVSTRRTLHPVIASTRRIPWRLSSTSSPISTTDNDDITSDPHSLDSLLTVLRSSTSPTSSSSSSSSSTVYLVGTGPGDPGFLTMRAVQLMQRAHVVLYDRLVSQSILHYVNNDAIMIYVGKEAGFHTRTQSDIHLLLSHFSRSPSHSIIVRLKGGDPFVFGRGGEETDFLEQCGTRVVAVPGITAASGIAAALGIPLTMRGYATSVRFLTGHVVTGTNLQFGHVDMDTTYVVYMGLGQLQAIANHLVKQGLSSDVPAVAVQKGTTDEQRVIAAPLCKLYDLVTNERFHSPTLIVIGSVVSLAACWIEHKEQVIEGYNLVNDGIGMSFESLDFNNHSHHTQLDKSFSP